VKVPDPKADQRRHGYYHDGTKKVNARPRSRPKHKVSRARPRHWLN